jgi:hypothetical protein
MLRVKKMGKRVGLVLTALFALFVSGLFVRTNAYAAAEVPDASGKYIEFWNKFINSSKGVGSSFYSSDGSAQNGFVDNFIFYNQAGNRQYMWSAQNDFDLSHKVTMGFWVKVPADVKNNTNSKNDGDDGLAFVLAKSNAQTTSSSTAGESLGVFADPKWTTQGSAKPTFTTTNANSAIRDSFAIEFDTNPNNGDGAKVSGTSSSEFDYGMTTGTPHVAWAYPALASSYGITNADNQSRYRLFLKHNGGENATGFSAGSWVHVSLVYNGNKSNPQLTYTVNDKNIDNSTNADAKSVTVDLDTDNLGDAKKLYWGFTSANSSTDESMANRVVFDDYSETYAPAVTVKVNGTSAYDSLSDDVSKAIKVHNGDSIETDLMLMGIRQESLDDGTVDVTLPKYVNWDPQNGSYGTISYSNGKDTYTQPISQDSVSAINGRQMSIKLGSSLQNKMSANAKGIRNGDLTVKLNTTVTAVAGTSVDGFEAKLNDKSVGLNTPGFEVLDNSSIDTVQDGKTLNTNNGPDASNTNVTVSNGATVTNQYKISNIGSAAIKSGSLLINSSALTKDSSGNYGTITYSDGTKTNTQNINSIPSLTISDDLLSGISSGELSINLNLKIDADPGTKINSGSVGLNLNGVTYQTFHGPKLSVANPIVSQASVKVQDLNFNGDIAPDNDDHKAQLQDVLRYTYTLTYDAKDSQDKQWKNVVLTPQLVQDNNQYYLEMRNVTVNGVQVATNSGNMPTGFQVKIGDLDAKDADADGKVTVTVVIDCELGYLQNGVTQIPTTTATFAGTGDSGSHQQDVTNPSYGVVNSSQGLFYTQWNRLAVYNKKGVASDTIDIHDKSVDGSYTLKNNDGYVVLQGWTGNTTSNMDQYVEINGEQVKGPIALTNANWNYSFTRSGYTGKIDHSEDQYPTNAVTEIGGLKPGINHIRIYAVDRTTGRRALAGGGESIHYPYIEYTIIDPAPSLSVDNDVHFADTTLSGQSEYAATTEDAVDPFALKIMYANASASAYNWTLSAATTDFTSGSDKLRGELLYQKDGKTLILSKDATPLYSDQSGVNDATQVTSSDTDSDGTYDVAGKWTHSAFDKSSSNGLYMHVFPDAVADENSSDYTGTITWTFSSTPTSSTN